MREISKMKMIEHLKRPEFKWLMVICLIIVVFLPFLVTRDLNLISFKDTGPIGDTIGGITAPFINLISIILVFITFQEQVEANKRLKEANDDLKNLERQKMYADEYNGISSRIEKITEYLGAFEERLKHGENPYDLGRNLFVQLSYTSLFIYEFKTLFNKCTKGNHPNEDIAYRLNKIHSLCLSQYSMSLGPIYKLRAEEDPIGSRDVKELTEELLDTTLLVLNWHGKKAEDSIKSTLEAIRAMQMPSK